MIKYSCVRMYNKNGMQLTTEILLDFLFYFVSYGQRHHMDIILKQNDILSPKVCFSSAALLISDGNKCNRVEQKVMMSLQNHQDNFRNTSKSKLQVRYALVSPNTNQEASMCNYPQKLIIVYALGEFQVLCVKDVILLIEEDAPLYMW